MLNTEVKIYEVITYTDKVLFNYTLPEEEEARTIEHELTIQWEDTIEKFIETHGENKEYKVHTFTRERERNNLIKQIESKTEDLVDEIQEEITNKTKFGFDFTGQLHNDD